MANDDTDNIPDLVILHCRMRQISVKEVLTGIKKLPYYTHIPIVDFTSIIDRFILKKKRKNWEPPFS